METEREGRVTAPAEARAGPAGPWRLADVAALRVGVGAWRSGHRGGPGESRIDRPEHLGAAACAQHRACPLEPLRERCLGQFVDCPPALGGWVIAQPRLPQAARDPGQPARSIELGVSYPGKVLGACAGGVDVSETERGHDEMRPLDWVWVEGTVVAEGEVEKWLDQRMRASSIALAEPADGQAQPRLRHPRHVVHAHDVGATGVRIARAAEIQIALTDERKMHPVAAQM